MAFDLNIRRVNTPSIGQNPAFHFISGTGAHDIITITKNGGNADVSIQAFSNASYSTALNVPGSGGASTTYSYTLALDRDFIVDGGDLNDRFVIDGDLGINVLVRGMSGTDQLIVIGNGGTSATYTAGSNSANGLDGNANLGGTFVMGATTIQFQEFEAGSAVLVRDIGTVTFRTPLGADSLTLGSPIAAQSQISGTTGGVAIVPFRFSSVTDLIVDAGFGDGVGAADQILVNNLDATGLNGVSINTGGGDDILTIGTLNALPGQVAYDGGVGNDRLGGSNVANVWTVSGTHTGSLAPSAVNFSAVEILDGGTAVDTFNILASGGTIDLNGNGGNDVFNLSSDGAALNGNVSAISGTVNVDGGSGINQLAVSDVTGMLNGNVVITNNAITGIAPATINYMSSGGGDFSGPGIYDGVRIRGIGGSTDTFRVSSFLASNTLQIEAGGGDDVIVTEADAFGNMKLDGQSGSDIVSVQMIDGARRVDARDSGAGQSDKLTIFGLAITDEFVIRATSVRRNVVDRVDFNTETEALEVWSLEGEDVFNFAASSTESTEVRTGNGADFVQVIDTAGGVQALTILGGGESDRVRILATKNITSTMVDTQDDNDFVFIGSNATMNNGSLDRMLGPIEVSGGTNATGEDRLYINDRATPTGQIYEVDPDSVASLSPRPFNGPIMHDSFEVLRLDGTDLRDEFVVYPSFTTRLVIDGNQPNREDIACAEEGDFLNLVAPASSGRKLNFTDVTTGSGSWTFSNGFQGVHFTSIEKFNHVARLAV